MSPLIFVVPAVFLLVHSFYDSRCCGSIDCHPIPCEQLVEARGGWLYLPSGNFFLPEQVMPSEDRHCHVCISNTMRSLCAYIQQGA